MSGLTASGEALLEWAKEPHPGLRWWADATLRLMGGAYILTAVARWLGWV